MESSDFSDSTPVSGPILADSQGALADRRVRASLRRLAAGEQRKRSMRLSEALRDDAFCLRYLPRQRLGGAGQGAADRIEGAELWVGLPNRRRGLVSVAPLLRDLDQPLVRQEMLRFTLDAAAAEVAIWPERWRIAVPVPGRTLADGAVCDVLAAALRQAGIGDGRVDLQIDESELVEGGAALHHAIGTLRDRGIGVILEGFGAIFGSLALLPRLPLTGLKLDRRLAHAGAPEDVADEITLIRASVEIAHRLGVAVTIDGIETEAEMQRIRHLGVDLVQGPWIGPAMSAEAIRARARGAG
ncbi:MAG: EAL domain-containing protein [Acidiphilium sp.]|nr:EAL domain-containing protein [Acidiphilium sp.]MDD4935270.1 EAL domain-containing protein [Acidiphilium sp.]